MSSLLSGLDIARQALQAQQFGLDVTENNISNVNTPGYSRQRVNMVPGEPIAEFDYEAGAGVRAETVQSFRSSFLDYRVNQELSSQSELDAASAALQQIESLFNENSDTGLQSAISNFYQSFSSLANTPEDTALRQQVLSYAQDLGAQFRQDYEHLQSIRQIQDGEIAETVSQINSLSSQIAQLNVEVVAARNTNGNESTLRDQRQVLVDQLASLVDISYCEDDTGSMMISTRQGTLLVAGSSFSSWQAVTSATSGNLLEIHAGNTDITSTIQSGKLGGLLQVRDNNTASYLNQLDNMAAGIISSVNAQHVQGTDLNGDPGVNFFVPFTQLTPGSNTGAARAIQVAITSSDKIAVAGAGEGPGSNTNAKALAELQNQPLAAGSSATVNQLYQNLVFQIGLDSRSALDGLNTQNQLLTQLQNQRDSASGVNLDDEAVSVLRYQKAYEASARFISVIDTLTQDLLNLIGA